MIYNPLYSIFREGSVSLQVQRTKYNQPLCDGCWYSNEKNYTKSCFVHGHVCTPLYRKDKLQVRFVKVEQ